MSYRLARMDGTRLKVSAVMEDPVVIPEDPTNFAYEKNFDFDYRLNPNDSEHYWEWLKDREEDVFVYEDGGWRHEWVDDEADPGEFDGTCCDW